VAVKVLNASSRDESWVRDRFAYEVAALRSVDHPGVSPILDSWVSPAGEPCLVMPFLEGPTLRTEMASGPLSPDRVARIVRKLGSALAEVHGRGIVHRDLKPENVILWKSAPEGERPILIDFGMASLRGTENRMWNTTLLGGSLHYMAPERLTGHYSQASDIYSFGVMILEMLSGKRLADLGVMVTDGAFPDALGRALAHVVAPENLPLLVENLRQCYSAEPQRRPSDVGPWAEAAASCLAIQRSP
jgi:serine/threonine protein kinase